MFELRKAAHRGANAVRRIPWPPRQTDPTVERVRREGLTYLDVPALTSLRSAVVRAERLSIPGSIVEAGCAEGGSAIVMAAAKDPHRRMFIYDVFGMIPPPGSRDGVDVHRRFFTIQSGNAVGVGGRLYYGYRPNLLEEVEANFARCGVPTTQSCVSLVPGLFDETLHPDGPVAVAHVDGDWYDSVSVCLRRILPVLSPGGVVVVDDYYAWSGCADAVHDVTRGLDRSYGLLRWRNPRAWIVRRGPSLGSGPSTF